MTSRPPGCQDPIGLGDGLPAIGGRADVVDREAGDDEIEAGVRERQGSHVAGLDRHTIADAFE